MTFILTAKDAKQAVDAKEIQGCSNQMHQIPFLPFSIQTIISPKGSTINIIRKNNEILGGFTRDYSSFAAEIFKPFYWEGQWYATYSHSYTTLRVMRINENSIEDWCGEPEDKEGFGFCPVEVVLPLAYKGKCQGYMNHFWLHSFDSEEEAIAHKRRFGEITYLDAKEQHTQVSDVPYFMGVGIYSGCIWGDDSNWKIRYIDYRKVAQKEVLIKEAFSYVEQPIDRKLADCIQCMQYNGKCFSLITMSDYDIDDMDETA